MTRAERIEALKAAARERILILDGSWGVMIQRRGLAEADYRGERFADHPVQLKGDNDILCITRPDIIADLHDQYYAAGADIGHRRRRPQGTLFDQKIKQCARIIRARGNVVRHLRREHARQAAEGAVGLAQGDLDRAFFHG